MQIKMTNSSAWLVTIATVLSSIIFPAYSQTPLDSLKDLVSRNIIAFHVRKAKPFELGLAQNEMIATNRLFFVEIWPSKDYQLNAKWEKIDISFPNSEQTLYHVTLQPYIFTNRNTGNVSMGFDFPQFSYDHDYLVAINKKNEIKFLSGNFFKTPISQYYNLKKDVPESFIEYLKISLFNVSPQKIKYQKRKKHYLLFTAVTKDNVKMVLSVHEKNFDIVKINYMR